MALHALLAAAAASQCPAAPTEKTSEHCQNGLLVAKTSRCPSDRYLSLVTPNLIAAQRDAPFVLLNVGANKGWQIADWYARWGNYNYSAWHGALQREGGLNSYEACGRCGQCWSAAPTPDGASAATAPRAVAIEAQPVNADLLRRVLRISGLDTVVDVVNAGASNVTGTLKLTPIRHAGVETGHIAETGRKAGGRAKAERTIDVPAVTVDSIVASHQLSHVTLLAIDVEGFDALVLDGAKELLSRRGAQLVEFEYHGVGMWKSERSLKAEVERMCGWGYECFWSGAPGAPPLGIFGALHPLRPWCPRFETRRYSNVVCAHDDGVKAALRGLTLARAAGEFKQAQGK